MRKFEELLKLIYKEATITKVYSENKCIGFKLNIGSNKELLITNCSRNLNAYFIISPTIDLLDFQKTVSQALYLGISGIYVEDQK